MKCASTEKNFRPTWRSAILLAVLALLYLIIFSFSAQDGETSADLSNRITLLFSDAASESFPTVDYVIRKLAHAGEFAVLYLVWHLLLTDAFPSTSAAFRYLFSLLLVAFSATGDELSQRLSVGRACRFSDVLIDLAGASAMALFLAGWRRIFASRRKRA